MAMMTLRGMFWMGVGMGALALGMLVAMQTLVPLALFTMSVVMAAVAWVKMPAPGPRCLCGHTMPEGSRFCNHCGSRCAPEDRAR